MKTVQLQENEYLATIDGHELKVSFLESGRVAVNGKEYSVDFQLSRPGEYSLLLDVKSFRVSTILSKNVNGSLSFQQSLYITLSSKQFKIDIDDKRSLLFKSFSETTNAKNDLSTLQSPMPGLVVKIEVKEGDEVQAGQGLVVLEAMKMENELKATDKGKVTAIHVKAGQTVDKSQSLLTISHL